MNSAQGSITIRRLRNGDSIYISFDTNDVDLYQGVDVESGEVSPDWTVAANQPIRTPRVVSSNGNAVGLSQHTWSRAGIAIVFSVDKGQGWFADATGTFQMNTTTGALRITKNLATKTTLGSINLKWSAVLTTQGAEQSIAKDMDVRIGNMGSSSYVGAIVATTEQISSTTLTTILKSSLRLGSVSVTDYYPKWWKDDTAWTAKNGDKNPVVTRNDVDGTQLFICRFYKNSTDTTELAVYAIRIIDVSDEYQVNMRITSAQKDIDAGKPVTVQGYVYNATTGTQVTPSGATWALTAYINGGDFAPVKTSNTNTITVSTAESDRGGNLFDIVVTGEVTF